MPVASEVRPGESVLRRIRGQKSEFLFDLK